MEYIERFNDWVRETPTRFWGTVAAVAVGLFILSTCVARANHEGPTAPECVTAEWIQDLPSNQMPVDYTIEFTIIEDEQLIKDIYEVLLALVPGTGENLNGDYIDSIMLSRNDSDNPNLGSRHFFFNKEGCAFQNILVRKGAPLDLFFNSLDNAYELEWTKLGGVKL